MHAFTDAEIGTLTAVLRDIGDGLRTSLLRQAAYTNSESDDGPAVVIVDDHDEPAMTTPAARAYFDRIAGYMDAVQPDLSVDKNVNTGDRAGVRAAVTLAPNDRLAITPRFFYQSLDTDGWNRIDIYNILGNPFTTTRPAVTLGERELFTQIGEPMTDRFYLGDLNIRLHHLCTWWDVLEFAKTCGQFDPIKLAEIEKFLHDPAGWSKAHGVVAVAAE